MESHFSLSREPEDVIISRNGSVLGKKTVLKSDHFPGCQNKRLLPHVEGAPNYRQVANLPVYGVAIPTVEGIRNVLDLVGASRDGGRRVIWHNMREEPVIYVNGRPFVLREVERPFTNLEYTGIDRARVEQMESRLKEDVLHEASRYGNKVMVSDELPDGQMVDLWEPIGPDSVQTPLEVYNNLQLEGYGVDYERVPVTDEKSPKERDFDLLVHRLGSAEKDVAQLFNCQMGRGRTTTAMVVATLIHLRQMSSEPQYFDWKADAAEEASYEATDPEEVLRRGEYTVIRSLTRVLEGGLEGKRQVDTAIDKCAAMQNLREAILGYRNSIHRQADEKKREAALSLFVEYLERYYFLICFAVYIHTDPRAVPVPAAPQNLLEALTPGKGPTVDAFGAGQILSTRDTPEARSLESPRAPSESLNEGASGFRSWMRQRPELYSILRRLLRRDPMSALGFQSGSHVRLLKTSLSLKGQSSDMANLVAARTGEVLGRSTVLKSDHCPGCQNLNLPERVEGAPNFREVSGFPVYGVANPTVEGIRAVLERVGCQAGSRKVLWHNMREEPTVYINGKPFVLREMERPFKNMLEYTGIDKARVEQMEARLKEDVLREAEKFEHSIMVNHETEEGEIFDAWEPVLPGGTSVQTPAEVYSGLQKEGYAVDYARVPITDGKAPKSRDFDALAQGIARADPSTALVFNCQMGRGRTTTGTVIACLVLTRCLSGRPLQLPPSGRMMEGIHGGESSSDDDAEETAESNVALPAGHRQNATSGCDKMDSQDKSMARPKPLLASAPSKPISIPKLATSRPPREAGGANGTDGDMETEEESHDGSAATSLGYRRKKFSWVHGSRNGLDLLQSLHSESYVDLGFLPMAREQAGTLRGGVNQEMAVHFASDMSPSDAEHAASFVPQTGAAVGTPDGGKLSKAAIVEAASFSMEDIAIVRKITRLLERGVECRAVLDTVIDRCATMQNIRQAILRYRRAFNHQDENTRVRQSALSRGMEYLERYYMLIVFTAYLDSPAFQPSNMWNGSAPSLPHVEPLSFKEWIKRRPEIRQMKWSMRLRPARLFTIPEVEFRTLGADSEGSVDAVMEAVVKAREGQVLGRGSILKMYLFPDLVNSSDRLPVPGAPHINRVEGFPVHSMATPSVDGAKAVLASLKAAPCPALSSGTRSAKPPRKVIVTDLREEAVVYICGQPFVLRELDQPVSTLKHVGVEGPVVEQMEVRMKADILAEASQLGGKILLHRESAEKNPATGQSDIIGYWQAITPTDVATPAEVYQALKKEGYRIDYCRIPLTRERAPKPSDVDGIQRRADRAGRDAEFLFVSHTGFGGVAYAMAIMCLRLHADNKLVASSFSPSAPTSVALSSSPPQLSTSAPTSTFWCPSTPKRDTSSPPRSFPSSPTSPLAQIKQKFQSPLAPGGVPLVSPLPVTPFPLEAPPPSPKTAARGLYSKALTGGIDFPTSPVSKMKLAPFQEVGDAFKKGDYRDILSLERVLVHGPASKFEADTIIDRLAAAGRLRDDIWQCWEKLKDLPEGEQRAALLEEGIRALRRYCYLIVFRAYLYARVAEHGTTYAGESAFASWISDRPELGHMCDNLKLQ